MPPIYALDNLITVLHAIIITVQLKHILQNAMGILTQLGLLSVNCKKNCHNWLYFSKVLLYM
jgi:hypothetical protein